MVLQKKLDQYVSSYQRWTKFDCEIFLSVYGKQRWIRLGKYHFNSDIRNFISHITYYSLMFVIVYAFKGQVHVFAGWVRIVSHSSCRPSAILKYFCPLIQVSFNSLNYFTCGSLGRFKSTSVMEGVFWCGLMISLSVRWLLSRVAWVFNRSVNRIQHPDK